MQLVRSQIEHEEPNNVGFFNFQCADMKLLELNYNFFRELGDTDKYGEMDLNADPVFLALAEKHL